MLAGKIKSEPNQTYRAGRRRRGTSRAGVAQDGRRDRARSLIGEAAITSLTVSGWQVRGRELFPGLLACGVVAAAAAFLAQHYGAPVMLFALLLGMAMNFLSAEGRCAPGIEFAARHVLRVGVALLGVRITFEQIAALGGQPVAGRRGVRRRSRSRSRRRGAAVRLQQPVRRAHRRRHRDLRRVRGARARGGAARASAQGARDAVHRDRRERVVDARDDPLSDASCARSGSTDARPASSSAARSTTWRRWSAPATACRRRPATSPPTSS